MLDVGGKLANFTLPVFDDDDLVNVDADDVPTDGVSVPSESGTETSNALLLPALLLLLLTSSAE